MKRIAALALGTAAVLAAPTAFAGGPVVPVAEPVVAAPAPVAVVAPATGDWNGGYLGAQLGYADGGDVDGDGALGGIHGGYRWDLGRTVLGVEGAYNSADVSSDDDAIKLDNLATLTGQVGYDLGRTLVYAKGGVAYGDGDFLGQDSASDYGYTAGLGVDYQLNQNWTVGGEVSTYVFDDFDDTGVSYNPTAVQLKAAYNF
ncbi:outer membrane protein [Falsirhodobacter sp. 20TX0035]|uniref:outer membrane protein n=1 Tax=Falsirhodobacter sp. 20TX0035 TaxID=3022019 RepID=UPI00232F8EE2|nr:outer membrane beta-barrel protein [Falsirhodobacter sp. 20TX0035]MDB6453393.1 outer membrane beta-barrel protein [Falsirhodobacter sp. 20TX0035]